MLQMQERPIDGAADNDVDSALNPLIALLDQDGPEPFMLELKDRLTGLRAASGAGWFGDVM